MKKRLAIIGTALAVVMLATTAAFASHLFSDVPDNSTHADEIEWAAENGIVEGYPDGTFKPGAPVERQHAAAMFKRYASISAPTNSRRAWSLRRSRSTCAP